MRGKKLVALLAAIGWFGVVGSGFAQDSSARPRRSVIEPLGGTGKALASKLDEVSRTVLGGILPINRGTRKSSPHGSRLLTRNPNPTRKFTTPRAGSVTNASSTSTTDGRSIGRSATVGKSSTSPAPQHRATALWEEGLATRADRRPAAKSPAQPAETKPASDVRTPMVTGGNSRVIKQRAPVNIPDLSANPVLRPLHERLSAFRQSAFGEAARSRPQTKVDSQPQSVTDPPVVKSSPSSEASNATVVTPKREVLTPSSSRESTPTGRPVIAQRIVPRGSADGVSSQAQVPVSASVKSAPPMVTKSLTQKSVLFSRKGPMLSVETAGPRKISVGKESAYAVSIYNSGEAAADEVVVYVNLPAWADVVAAEASTGATHLNSPGGTGEPFAWSIGRLAARGRERLVLRIVPRERKPFDLGVRWDYEPVASQAVIEVQEPCLEMQLEGPREVLYGKKEIYKLKLSNTGNGDAENVVITLMPIGDKTNQPISHTLGTLAAGEKKTIEVELTARQAGSVAIQVAVRGDGGVHAELAEKVLVRRAALAVNVEGPKVQYVGTSATYRIQLSNPGTAPARNVKLSANIPPGAKYLASLDGGRLEADGTTVQWTLASLNPGAEQSFTMTCSLGRAGLSRVTADCAADDELTASASTTTEVEAMADLVLDVKDPPGPVSVGQEAAYELRIRNRGTKNAEGVEVVAYFSRGVEPVSAEGAQHRIGPGQVVFSPISSLAAGAELALKIRAQAETTGNHIFRVEVHCKPLGTRLVSEDTTHFYQDESAPRPASDVSSRKPYPADTRPLHSADRRALPTGP